MHHTSKCALTACHHARVHVRPCVQASSALAHAKPAEDSWASPWHCRASRRLCLHRCGGHRSQHNESQLCNTIRSSSLATAFATAACLCVLFNPPQAVASSTACDATMSTPAQQQEYSASSSQIGVDAATPSSSAPKTSLLAELAALFEERDPIEAFTLYGTTFKKFVIEQLDGEKVVSRKRGFTVDTCVASARQSEETPSFRFLPVGEKVRISENTLCKRTEGAELKLTCYGSCELACTAGLDRWAAENTARTGFQLLDKDRERLLRSCARECTQDCTRPGKAYDFVITYRK